MKLISEKEMCQTLFSLLNTLSSSFNESEANAVIGGARKRVSQALEDLHSLEKTIESNDMLLVSTVLRTSIFYYGLRYCNAPVFYLLGSHFGISRRSI